jgi:hypothetical protein
MYIASAHSSTIHLLLMLLTLHCARCHTTYSLPDCCAESCEPDLAFRCGTNGYNCTDPDPQPPLLPDKGNTNTSGADAAADTCTVPLRYQIIYGLDMAFQLLGITVPSDWALIGGTVLIEPHMLPQIAVRGPYNVPYPWASGSFALACLPAALRVQQPAAGEQWGLLDPAYTVAWNYYGNSSVGASTLSLALYSYPQQALLRTLATGLTMSDSSCTVLAAALSGVPPGNYTLRAATAAGSAVPLTAWSDAFAVVAGSVSRAADSAALMPPAQAQGSQLFRKAVSSLVAVSGSCTAHHKTWPLSLLCKTEVTAGVPGLSTTLALTAGLRMSQVRNASAVAVELLVGFSATGVTVQGAALPPLLSYANGTVLMKPQKLPAAAGLDLLVIPLVTVNSSALAANLGTVANATAAAATALNFTLLGGALKTYCMKKTVTSLNLTSASAGYMVRTLCAILDTTVWYYRLLPQLHWPVVLHKCIHRYLSRSVKATGATACTHCMLHCAVYQYCQSHVHT